MKISFRRCICVGILLTGAGCASVDLDAPKTASYQLSDTADSIIGREAAMIRAGQGETSGFHLQLDGIESWATRLVLASRAERSIDAQYYLISDDEGGLLFLQSLLAAADRGVRVRVLTNSLAANNHGIVHSGYMSCRKKLLQIGVERYEMKADAEITGGDRGGSGAALAALHTKAFLVDGDTLFLGSFNWDPRSAIYNTEMGVVIYSKRVSDDVYNLTEARLAQSAYLLQLSDSGSLQWLDESGAVPIILDGEPDVSRWRKFTVNLGRILPIKRQL